MIETWKLSNYLIGQSKEIHPPFKATWTGARRTRLGNYDFFPTYAETKRKNIILDHMNSRICLGSSQFWLHKFGQITIKFSGSPCGQERLNSNSRVASDHQIVIIIMKTIFMCKNDQKLKLEIWKMKIEKDIFNTFSTKYRLQKNVKNQTS